MTRENSVFFISAMLLMFMEEDPVKTPEKGLSALIQLQWSDSKMSVARSDL